MLTEENDGNNITPTMHVVQLKNIVSTFEPSYLAINADKPDRNYPHFGQESYEGNQTGQNNAPRFTLARPKVVADDNQVSPPPRLP